ncbi:MAG: hypothetical protein WKF84_24865 [Pyrinomonadaceae bacterium]
MRACPNGAATVGESSKALWVKLFNGLYAVPRYLDLLGRRRLGSIIRSVANIFIGGGEASIHRSYSGTHWVKKCG